ncbi:PspA/IM30 family protein [Microbulbifer thermotolerans]|uniref:PspA/IM30 family protein n=1 Tax=Microbulbifer thermotolerans TaxID=252514 RepID=UPI00224A6169|nr:PspA/IM30 family protein [Microbulbifer thermotolerans]MCX2779138.1 PspA/IM30 family protein [Microbulbifer thermotolerans]MCX2806419.1 PspA/IM30 family protein [Microbulbifer thermotolerans]
MKEGLVKRISRIISASVNALVDSVENVTPQLVMEQAIREIDEAIQDVRDQLGKAEAAKYLSSKALNDENSRHSSLAEQIDIAVREGRDDLAEVAIAKQMDIEAQLPVLEKAIADADAEINELNAYISALLGKKREMREQLREFAKASEHVADGPSGGERGTSRTTANKVDQATGAFNRVLERAGVPTAESSADAGKLAELEELARNNRIQERLAKIKSEAKV